MEIQKHYLDFHAELLAFIGRHFSQVQSGLQGDSWIWILDGEVEWAIDTFTSVKHQIKSPKAGLHVQRVIEALGRLVEVQLRSMKKLCLKEDEYVQARAPRPGRAVRER